MVFLDDNPEPNGDPRDTTEFRTQLENLINSFALESVSDTPDFILANYLEDCLEAFDRAVTQREVWYGRSR